MMHRRQGMAFKGCQRIRYTILLFLTLALIIGCSSNKDDPVGNGANHSGVFIDSPVEGLTYETPTHSGTTDADGTFHFEDRQTVTFSVGGVVLGTEGVGAYHGIELVYLFNYIPSLYVHHAMGLTGLPAGEPAPATGWGVADVQMVDSLMSMWAQFALTGDPSLPSVTWTPHTSAVREYLEMGQGGALTMEDGLENAFD